MLRRTGIGRPILIHLRQLNNTKMLFDYIAFRLLNHISRRLLVGFDGQSRLFISGALYCYISQVRLSRAPHK